MFQVTLGFADYNEYQLFMSAIKQNKVVAHNATVFPKVIESGHAHNVINGNTGTSVQAHDIVGGVQLGYN